MITAIGSLLTIIPAWLKFKLPEQPLPGQSLPQQPAYQTDQASGAVTLSPDQAAEDPAHSDS
jgi:hypothetical protein